MTAPLGISRGLLALVVVALAGCGEHEFWQTDPVVYGKAFESCMGKLPHGQDATTFSDWDEVVSQCRDAARTQSLFYGTTSDPRAQPADVRHTVEAR